MKDFIKELKNNLSRFLWIINNDVTIDEIQLGDYLSSYCTFEVLKNEMKVSIFICDKNKYKPENEYTFLKDSNDGKEILDLISKVKSREITPAYSEETMIVNSANIINNYFA